MYIIRDQGMVRGKIEAVEGKRVFMNIALSDDEKSS